MLLEEWGDCSIIGFKVEGLGKISHIAAHSQPPQSKDDQIYCVYIYISRVFFKIFSVICCFGCI